MTAPPKSPKCGPMVAAVLEAVCAGFTYDPGTSDLDNEQPIDVRMTLGDYRRARRILNELRPNSPEIPDSSIEDAG